MTFRNLVELHRHQAECFGPRPALRYRRYGLFHDVTWTEYREAAVACASALIDAGIAPGDRIGLLAENRLEWLIADMGIMTAGAINVPAHAGMPAGPVARQLADAGCSWLFVSTAGQLAKAREIRKELPELKGVVVFDRAAAAPDATSWQGFLQRGRQALPRLASEIQLREERRSPNDLATIMYTSGTTGVPKGVMLSHLNLASNAEALIDLVKGEDDVILLCWLPLSHIFGRLCDHYFSLRAGILMALADSVDSVPFDIMEVRPTHIHGVPRFWEKMLAAAQASPAPDKMLKGMFGGRVRWLMSGGAPLPPKVCQAYRDAGLPLMQGYGLTESAPVLTTNRPNNYRVESAGLAIPGVELKIADDGEILARGPNIMRGYWNQPEATAATVRDGWLYTGDMGRIDAHGFLYITGRKKELIVLSNGKKVAPTEVEAMLQGDPCIEQSIVFGDTRNFLVAVIVPNWPKTRQALPAAAGSDEELTRNPDVLKLFRDKIDRALVNTAPWEQVKKFILRPQPFTPERGELTVSLKLKRDVIYQRHAPELESLYRDEGA
jgi:long-chain acyl-CoA synthetase